MSKKKDNVVNWYDNAKTISNLIITTILIIIICSQSFAVVGESSLALFGSVINYNTIYLLVLVYFVLLKFKLGKRYFNYLNLFLVCIYFLSTVTSFLTLIQSFGLVTLLSFILNLVLVLYLFHTMFRDTRVWNEFKLESSPFNEVTNDMSYYVIIILVIFVLVVNLISTLYLSGVVLSILDSLYVALFGRFVYLYRDYLDYKCDNITNNDKIDIPSENGKVEEKEEDVINNNMDEVYSKKKVSKSKKNTIKKEDE